MYELTKKEKASGVETHVFWVSSTCWCLLHVTVLYLACQVFILSLSCLICVDGCFCSCLDVYTARHISHHVLYASS